MVKAAKAKGIPVTASCAAYSLFLTEESLEQFDTNLKVNPPLRTKKDLKALLKGLNDGTIDAISSFHSPHESEAKEVEFEQAEFGMSALETAFSMINSALQGKLALDQLITKLSIEPRKILNREPVMISEGQKANLTFFDPSQKWIYEESSSRSKSRNSPLFGKQLVGKIYGIINNNKLDLV